MAISDTTRGLLVRKLMKKFDKVKVNSNVSDSLADETTHQSPSNKVSNISSAVRCMFKDSLTSQSNLTAFGNIRVIETPLPGHQGHAGHGVDTVPAPPVTKCLGCHSIIPVTKVDKSTQTRPQIPPKPPPRSIRF